LTRAADAKQSWPVPSPAPSSAPHPYAAAHRPLLGIGLRVAAMFFMTGLAALVKACGDRGVPLFEIIFFRNAFAFVPLGLYIFRTTGWEVLRTRRPLGHLTRSAVGLSAMACNFSALHHLQLTEATALQFASPLFMTGLSALLLAEPVGWHRWAAVVVGFVGVVIMARPSPGHMNLVGVALGLSSAFLAAGAMVAIRQIASTERGPTIVFYFTLGGTVLGLVGTLAHGWRTPDATTLGLLIAAGLTGGVGQLLLTEALRAAPVGIIAPFDYTQLVWAGILGLTIWGELPQALTLAGAAIVAASGVYILRRELIAAQRARAS
jgi:drug/metabolite transporter (DMT)-like permease